MSDICVFQLKILHLELNLKVLQLTLSLYRELLKFSKTHAELRKSVIFLHTKIIITSL